MYMWQWCWLFGWLQALHLLATDTSGLPLEKFCLGLVWPHGSARTFHSLHHSFWNGAWQILSWFSPELEKCFVFFCYHDDNDWWQWLCRIQCCQGCFQLPISADYLSTTGWLNVLESFSQQHSNIWKLPQSSEYDDFVWKIENSVSDHVQSILNHHVKSMLNNPNTTSWKWPDMYICICINTRVYTSV